MIRRSLAVLAVVTAPATAQTVPRDDALAFDRGLEAYFAGDHHASWFFWLGPAERGYAEAQFALGNLYLRGEGVPADPGLAARWFARAADLGHAEAKLNLALMLDAGDGIPRDRVAAYIHAIRAAASIDGEDRRRARDLAQGIARRMTPEEAERARRLLMESGTPARR
ncbi:MAG: sel1 repeat family protein [Azospirillum sp.]|jgi:TPR repeat protein|nr:sel1 repeat family protein [Azospirillum sp.]MCZ8123269.1 tetratricopeptide repeat protein [Magnetospirillum sp.]